jgi:transposase
MSSIVYGGLDVHKQSISVYLIKVATGEVVSEEVLNDRAKLVRAVKRWAKLGELRLCYEASSAGYVVKRWLDELGDQPKEQGGHAISCEVIAPSLIPKAPGDRVKTDKRDAKRLALLYKAGLLQPVRVPSPEEETVRALVRLMTSLTRDLTRAKNRATKYLRSLGYVYGENGEKTTWSERHRAWIASLPLGEVERLIVQTHLDSLDGLQGQKDELEKRLERIARTEAYWPKVQALSSLRGIGLYSALQCDGAAHRDRGREALWPSHSAHELLRAGARGELERRQGAARSDHEGRELPRAVDPDGGGLEPAVPSRDLGKAQEALADPAQGGSRDRQEGRAATAPEVLEARRAEGLADRGDGGCPGDGGLHLGDADAGAGPKPGKDSSPGGGLAEERVEARVQG